MYAQSIVQALKDFPDSTAHELIPHILKKYRRDPMNASYIRCVLQRGIDNGTVVIISENPRRYRYVEESK